MRGLVVALIFLPLLFPGPSWGQLENVGQGSAAPSGPSPNGPSPSGAAPGGAAPSGTAPGGTGQPSSRSGEVPDHDSASDRRVDRTPQASESHGPPQVVALLAATDPSEAQRLAEDPARRHALRVTALYPLFSMDATLAVFDISDQRPAEAIVSLLKREFGVLEADVNTSFEIQGLPPSRFQYAPRLLGAERAHVTLRGRDILVALVDTGIDAAHEDLRGVLAAQENLVEGDSQISPGMHGTAEAGLIAARLGSEVGIVGMAPEARIVALRACIPAKPGAAKATCLAHRVARGIDLAVQHRTQILNLSLGGPPNRVVTRLVLQAMIVHGLAVVAAAGNNGPRGPLLYPAAIPGVVATGATDNRDVPSATSYLGRNLSILAPGVDVMATLPDDRYAFVSGTSYAAAHVSGALALLMEARHDLSAPDIVAALKKGAVPVGGAGVGRVDLCRSLTLIGRPDVCR